MNLEYGGTEVWKFYWTNCLDVNTAKNIINKIQFVVVLKNRI